MGIFIANIVTLDRFTNIQLDSIVFIQGEQLIENLAQENLTNGQSANLHSEVQNRLVYKFKNTLLLEIDGPISFAVSRELSRRFSETLDFEILMIDLSQAKLIGTTTSIMIVDLVERCQGNNKQVIVITGNDKVKKTLHKLSLDSLVNTDKQFANRELAIQSLI